MRDLDRRILEFLHLGRDSYHGCYLCFPFAPICTAVGEGRAEVRRRCRAMARKGLVEYNRGLVDEDGEFAGAGYGITNCGCQALGKLDQDSEAA